MLLWHRAVCLVDKCQNAAASMYIRWTETAKLGKASQSTEATGFGARTRSAA